MSGVVLIYNCPVYRYASNDIAQRMTALSFQKCMYRDGAGRSYIVK